jgi:cysteine desulfurase
VSPKTPIYLDHHATTPLDPRVLDVMLPYYREDFGNAASSTHAFGWRAEAAVDDARERIAAAIGAEPREIVFTSGATESNNLALLGTARGHRSQGEHLVTTAIEHPSVLEPIRQLEREGFHTTVLDVDGAGLVDPDALRAAITDRTLLVSIAMANGEVGVLQPMAEIVDVCREAGVILHTDAAQALGKLPVRVDQLPVDLLSVSGHKIYGPKGVGVLYLRAGRPRIRPQPLFFGGGQERGLRSGTLAVPLVVGLAKALELCLDELASEAKRLTELRNHLWSLISAGAEGALLNGDPERRLPGNLNLSFPGADTERLLLALTDIALSSGSACSSASPEPSHVLLALGLPETLARASLRFGLGRGTTRAEIERAGARVLEELGAL